jgi:N-methylhydantoinase B
LPGAPPDVVVNPGEHEQHLLKCSRMPLARGDVVRTMTGGGGGFGDPRERDAGAVRDDLLDRHVTPAHARDAYGHERGAA